MLPSWIWGLKIWLLPNAGSTDASRESHVFARNLEASSNTWPSMESQSLWSLDYIAGIGTSPYFWIIRVFSSLLYAAVLQNSEVWVECRTWSHGISCPGVQTASCLRRCSSARNSSSKGKREIIPPRKSHSKLRNFGRPELFDIQTTKKGFTIRRLPSKNEWESLLYWLLSLRSSWCPVEEWPGKTRSSQSCIVGEYRYWMMLLCLNVPVHRKFLHKQIGWRDSRWLTGDRLRRFCAWQSGEALGGCHRQAGFDQNNNLRATSVAPLASMICRDPWQNDETGKSPKHKIMITHIDQLHSISITMI